MQKLTRSNCITVTVKRIANFLCHPARAGLAQLHRTFSIIIPPFQGLAQQCNNHGIYAVGLHKSNMALALTYGGNERILLSGEKSGLKPIKIYTSSHGINAVVTASFPLFLFIVFLLSLQTEAAGTFDFNTNCKVAYEEIFSLRIEGGKKLLATEK